MLALIRRLREAEAKVERVRAVMEWHETKGVESITYPRGYVDYIFKKALVHDEAAKRIREALDE